MAISPKVRWSVTPGGNRSRVDCSEMLRMVFITGSTMCTLSPSAAAEARTRGSNWGMVIEKASPSGKGAAPKFLCSSPTSLSLASYVPKYSKPGYSRSPRWRSLVSLSPFLMGAALST